MCFWRAQPRVSHILSIYSTTELHPPAYLRKLKWGSTREPTSPWSTEFLLRAFLLRNPMACKHPSRFCASNSSIEFSTLWAEENIVCLYGIIFSLYALDLAVSQLSWQRVLQEVQYKREIVRACLFEGSPAAGRSVCRSLLLDRFCSFP